MAVRVGIDLVSVEAVRESIRDHGDRYLKRIYNETEVEDCRAADGICAERLAARFAAKEATLKVLRPQDVAVPWRLMTIVRRAAGWVEIELSGLSGFALSIAHEPGYASAVVVAELDLRNRPDTPMMNL
jgi:holo-[acyl-carrier protein] synthase